MEICPLTPIHALTAARLHIDGQPGTFLTSLGPDVLTVLYQALPQSPVGFGFAAAELSSPLPPATTPLANLQPTTPQPAPISGFVSATTSIGSLLVEMSTRQILHFLPPLLKRFAQQPQLALRSVQTVLYPFLSGSHEAKGKEASAELLSIMVEPAMRSHGIGTQLMAALLDECQNRAITQLDVTVDAINEGAQRFYARHGFTHHHDFQLYGRAMRSLRCKVSTSRKVPNKVAIQ